MTATDRLLATVGLSALLCGGLPTVSLAQSELPEVTVKQATAPKPKVKARTAKPRSVAAAERRPAPPVRAARAAPRNAAPAVRTAAEPSGGAGGAPGAAGGATGTGAGVGGGTGTGVGTGIGNGSGVGIGDGAGGTDGSNIGSSAPVQSHFDAAEQRLETKVGTNQYDIGRRGIEELPQGDNTPIEKVVLQAPGVSQDSAASGDFHRPQTSTPTCSTAHNGIRLPEGVSGFGQLLETSFVGRLTLVDGALAGRVRPCTPPPSSTSRAAPTPSTAAVAPAFTAAASARSRR